MIALVAIQGGGTTSQAATTQAASTQTQTSPTGAAPAPPPGFDAPDFTTLAAVLVAFAFVAAAVFYGPAIWRAVWRTGQGDAAAGDPNAAAPGQGTMSQPLAFLLLVIAIFCVTTIFVFTMLLFWGSADNDGGLLFDDPAQVIAALSLVFTVIATLVGTYFGIKATGDARDTMERLTQTTTDSAASATRTAVDAIAAAQTGTTPGVDLVTLARHLHGAWNSGDEESVVGFFADEAEVRISPLPTDKVGTYAGREPIRGFVREYMPGSQVDSRNYRVEGSRVSWESTVLRDAGGGLPLEGTVVAVFEGRKIRSLVFTLSQATQQRLQEAQTPEQAADGGQESPAEDGGQDQQEDDGQENT